MHDQTNFAPPASWLDLPDAAPTPEVAAVYARTKDKLGYVRHNQRATAHRPALTLAQDAMSRAVNSDDTSGLTRRERELIALVVSVENRCTPCVFAHAAALRDATGNALWVARIEVNFRHADLSARERALADYAIRITCAPGEIEPADLDKLREAGVSEAETLDAAGVASYFNFSNRLNSALGVPPNDQAYAVGR